MYYSLHEVIPGARAREPVCPTARKQDHQPACRRPLAGCAAEPWEAPQLGHQHRPAGRPRSRARLPVLMLHQQTLTPAACAQPPVTEAARTGELPVGAKMAQLSPRHPAQLRAPSTQCNSPVHLSKKYIYIISMTYSITIS